VNRRALERHLKANGCFFHHHGGRHDIWVNSQTLAQAPVPRHSPIKRGTVRGICRLLGIPTPPGF
jgi:mRNA interferase HicA